MNRWPYSVWIMTTPTIHQQQPFDGVLFICIKKKKTIFNIHFFSLGLQTTFRKGLSDGSLAPINSRTVPLERWSNFVQS